MVDNHKQVEQILSKIQPSEKNYKNLHDMAQSFWEGKAKEITNVTVTQKDVDDYVKHHHKDLKTLEALHQKTHPNETTEQALKEMVLQAKRLTTLDKHLHREGGPLHGHSELHLIGFDKKGHLIFQSHDKDKTELLVVDQHGKIVHKPEKPKQIDAATKQQDPLMPPKDKLMA